ncbi:glycolate oxidase, subunit GlcD [Fonsecaea erecta]|uniref:Glycolate oxidase, subunit GlcD n=1 Tax=Fonsecaea erecta TaxID=1367422 RepID=A0A178ZC62_9EURO|nr:glycolate oxidase, subunit GlcD [Fonsecaea erecta]OAP56665.1 glycolate oxidase, subunit GlcD [Fonsecaea erecta]
MSTSFVSSICRRGVRSISGPHTGYRQVIKQTEKQTVRRASTLHSSNSPRTRAGAAAGAGAGGGARGKKEKTIFQVSALGLTGAGVAGLSLATREEPTQAEAEVRPSNISSSSASSSSSSSSSTLPLSSVPKVEHDTSPQNMRDAWKEFASIVGQENVSTETQDLLSHSGSEFQSCGWNPESALLGSVVVYPGTTEEVSELVKVCHRRRIPITPYSGGTSCEGHYVPHMGGVCIDFTRMDQIIEINPADLDCTVQPGIGWVDLNHELASLGLFFPPDPGPGAMIGGMVGTGCSGTNAAAYGTMKDWVLSLTVVLADGTIIKTRQRPRKSSAGFDLTRSFIGSEGTLGLVTEATLKLAVKPRCDAVAVSTFASVRDAARAVQAIIAQGIQVAAVEILDDVQMRSINQAGLTKQKWAEEPSLFFKFGGATDMAVHETTRIVGEIAKDHGALSYVCASDADEKEELWSARKNALWSVMAMRQNPSDRVWVTDVAVPMSQLADIIEVTKADIDQSGILGAIVGHVGDGNFHAILLFPDEERAIAEGLVHRMVDKALAMKGTVTGEHGVGLVKRDYLEKELGQTAVDTMRMVSLSLFFRFSIQHEAVEAFMIFVT